MRKADIVAIVADRADMSTRQADDAVSSAIEHIVNALARGESLNLVGFGSFQVKQRAARSGRHPKTGDAIDIAASKHVAFKPGKYLRDMANGS